MPVGVAAARQVQLVTRNIADFRSIEGLQVVDWWAE